MARKKIYDNLPERSDPNYMKLYAEMRKEELKKQGKLYRQNKLEQNPDLYKENYEKYLPTYVKYRQEKRDVISEKQWKSRGIVDMTYDKYLSELTKQEGKCKICNKEMKKPHVDHDHKTGKYRGLLCVSCNNGLGIYEKNRNVFDDYLKGTK